MGASASVGELPDEVDAATAARLLGEEFDADAFAQIAAECACEGVAAGCIPRGRFLAVSYTHLTLPTICSV